MYSLVSFNSICSHKFFISVLQTKSNFFLLFKYICFDNHLKLSHSLIVFILLHPISIQLEISLLNNIKFDEYCLIVP